MPIPANLATTLLFLIVIITPATAQTVELHEGCDCPTVRLDDSYCAASAVFEAVALGNDTVYANAGIEPAARNVIRSVPTNFLVSKVLKGDVAKYTIVYSAAQLDDCVYNFRRGERYIVFATSKDGMLQTNRCDATRPLEGITPGFLDSLEYVRAGNRWEGGNPVSIPCPE